MDISSLAKEWLKIDYYYMAARLGFIQSESAPSHELILRTIRAIDNETTMKEVIDTNCIITLLALMWEHVDKQKYSLNGFILKILTRIGYPTSAIIADPGYDAITGKFSAVDSIIDQHVITLQQGRFEVTVGNKSFLLTDFQKNLWNSLDANSLSGISAPTSAGKSFVILLKTAQKMLDGPLDVIYIVPTLSLLNQVTEDYNTLLRRVGVSEFLITNNLAIGESKAEHTIYVWTQEKAIGLLSSDDFNGFPHNTILVVDEIQNIERVQDDSDMRAKILFEALQEIRHIENVSQVIIAGPRINGISDLGKSLFGGNAAEIITKSSPVLSLTYSVKYIAGKFYFKQYCGLVDEPYQKEIEDATLIAGYGASSTSPEYLNYLYEISKKLAGDQNIFFAPTTTVARSIAVELSKDVDPSLDPELLELISFYKDTVHPQYTLCTTLQSGVAYHHGKLPVHVRRTIEAAIRKKLITNVACTTTLMQGVNLPAQNIIIRNPHLYTRHRQDSPELTSYEMANLRGRAGRLLKDFVGRTLVLDENEFEDTDGYDQQTLFDDTEKSITASYGDCFEYNRDAIVHTVKSDRFVDQSMGNYGHLVTYIRQSILRHGVDAKQRMTEVGISLTKDQIAAIILKLDTLSVPTQICLNNRYWDPFVLNDIFLKFKGKIPSTPLERGAKSKLSKLLKFLRDNQSTKDMYERYVPAQYRAGVNRAQLCSNCIQWASEKPLHEMLSSDYYAGEDAADRIEDTIKLLQDTVSYSIPLLIKPVIEMKNKNSIMVACLQTGAYQRHVRKMIEIGVPRELALRLGVEIKIDSATETANEYEYEMLLRNNIQNMIPKLSYWEQVQLDFLKSTE